MKISFKNCSLIITFAQEKIIYLKIVEIKNSYIKLIFGLKIKQLRQEKKLSFSELANKTSLSVSYLNEIENGKKYPKTDKIASLALALDTNYNELVSLKLSKNLTPIGELLESNILEQVPLDHYGIDLNKIMVQMSNAPYQLSALVATMIDMARSSELSQNNFSRTALRIYKEFYDNYFETIENSVNNFITEYHLDVTPPVKYDALFSILAKEYNYTLNETYLNRDAELKELRGVVKSEKATTLFLNCDLSSSQKSFVVAKELAYNYLKIKKRSFIHSSLQLNSFDHLLNNFLASYFATALILNKDLFLRDIESFFQKESWDVKSIFKLLHKYDSTPEMLFQRVNNLVPKFMGLNKFFFLRFNTEIGTSKYDLTKDLRLNIKHKPGGYQNAEHYCRRWISIEALKKLESQLSAKINTDEFIADILHSRFYDSSEEYLCFTIAQQNNLNKKSLSSVTIGFQVDDLLKQKIKFWNAANVPFRIVNDTCEMCGIKDCKERVEQPLSLMKIEKSHRLETAMKKLKKNVP